MSLGQAFAERPSTSYLPHVDGLRGVAIFLVVVYHVFPNLVPGGFIGVDMFFVISGFIITRQILHDYDEQRFSYFVFLARRVRRLIPAAFVCFTLVSVAASIILMPDALIQYGRNLIAAVLMYANLYNLHNSGYFEAPSDYKALLHVWSLSIEDQFYIVWPILLGLLLKFKLSSAKMLFIITVAATASVTYAACIVDQRHDVAFYVIFPRCFPLLLGCALAVATRAGCAVVTPVVVDALAVAAISASALLLNGGSAYPGLGTLPVCVGTLGLILSGLRGRTLFSRILGSAPLVGLGRMSYSLYLWHWPLLALARYRVGRPLTTGEAAVLAVSAVALSALSWRFVERPLRAGPLVPRRSFFMVIGTTAVTCGIAAAMIGGDGWSWRLDKPQRDFFVQLASRNPLREACDGASQAFKNDSSCAFGRKDAAEKRFDVAIFGDSNADHFVPMIAELAERRGWSGRQVTQSTCAPLIGAARPRPPREEEVCTNYQAVILSFLERNPNLKVAVLSAVWSGHYGPLSPNRLAIPRATGAEDFEGYVASTVRMFRDRGIKVMIIGQIPHFKSFPLPCFLEAVKSGAPDGWCGVPSASIEAELSRSLAIFRKLVENDPGVVLFDPAAALCGPDVCSPFKDGLFAYRDFGHLNAVGSRALSRYTALPE